MKNIFIDNNIYNNLKEFLKNDYLDIANILVITDCNVKSFYYNDLKFFLEDNFEITPHLITIPVGEIAKSRTTKDFIEDKMFSYNLGKDTLVIALGGGVVTDISGFVAATYYRGIPIVYIPTTLLAQVDASIGGKTGINTEFGKNMLGVIRQPNAVFICPEFLKTLSDIEYFSAFAEIIKHAIIADKSYFEFLLLNIEKIKQKDISVLMKIIKKSCEIKLNIVKQDEHEAGLREVLNFGHTIGHAIEKASDYRINHGQAIFAGILAESYISTQLGILSLKDFKLICEIIRNINMIHSSRKIIDSLPKISILNFIKCDKKNRANKIRVVLPRKLGVVYYINYSGYSHPIEESLILKSLENIEAL